jgi:plasmid stabilization system protein ParE
LIVSLPVILRHEAEVDIQGGRDQLEAVRVGLGNQVLARVGEVLARIEKMPELHGKVWEDVRAARLKQFRYIVYFIVLEDRIEVLAVLHGARDPSAWQSRA